MCTGEFMEGEAVGNYRVERALPTGTVGRSFLVSATGKDWQVVAPSKLNSPTKRRVKCVFKVVTFITRTDLVDSVVKDHRALTKLSHENVLHSVDMLDDGRGETLIFVTPFLERASCDHLVTEFESEEKLLLVLHDIGVGLRVLHSHRIYHRNLKLDNVLIRGNGSACIADAGFAHIFAAQRSEDLVFNGEVACMPPEVFVRNDNGATDAAKADIWGFGVLMYRLVYHREPFDIEGKTYEEVRQCILYTPIEFPELRWPFANELKEAIQWCLDRDPANRPTIIRLLRHSFFRNCMAQSISAGSTHLGTAGVSGTGVCKNSAKVASGAVEAAFARNQWCNSVVICATLGKGHNCETLLVHQRRNASKKFVVKALRHSILKKIEKSQDSNTIRHALVVCCEIRHISLLPFMEIVDGRDGCFVSQPYVEAEFLNKHFPPLANHKNHLFTVRRMLLDVLKGLYILHKNGVSHLSLTPSSIFFKEGVGFVIIDFGPLFCTAKEAASGGDDGGPMYNVPLWVLEDLKASPANAQHCIDTFCVGLLAASAEPSVLKEAWDIFSKRSRENGLVDDVIKKVSRAADRLSRPLVDFILSALTRKATVINMLSHPYLADGVDKSGLLEIRPLKISQKSMKNIVHERFHSRDESRLHDVLGQDPMAESALLSSMNLMDSLPDDGHLSPSFHVDPDLCNRLPFKDKIICGLCRVELPIVLFMCMKCDAYLRCGKCSLNDAHKAGHTMQPFLIHTIENREDGTREAILLPPTIINDTHPLEEIEMQANLPVGALTKFLKPDTTVAERSLGRLKMSGPKKQKKKALPKASEIEDISWEEEVRNCRENHCPELFLSRLNLGIVPTEVYDPPLTYVVSVDLSHNKLKSIPHELSFLHHIRSLIIANNELTELPDSLGNLSQLDRLDISHNFLEDLPQTFVYLHQLSTIAMDYNNFSGIPESIVELVSATSPRPILSVIYLAENPRISSLPPKEFLSMFPTLKLALDNEPTVHKTYIEGKYEKTLPNVSMMWNKIYPDRIVNRVFCGSLRSAQSQLVYEKLGIMSLLTVGRGLLPTPPIGGEHLTINIDDIEGADIAGVFSEAVNFIDNSVRKKKGCLVHCFAGMSRSAATVIAYLMIKQNMRLDEAYCTTKRGRPAIYPNHGFFAQLVKLDAELFPNQRLLDMASMERDKVPMG
ncbi:dual specificity protein phosphatase [Trypanosoma grayi]|uniref:dual specificity protein phosphatase n=1 Tax=Trypanosoma grayi TaxID=71804 RepID=UPI0004F4039B|nr:dual specificity protein phosphatase [Trypanosoma grayi]KEG09137.1 dual specificity protein phosphatase [Trypanosoma grayi]